MQLQATMRTLFILLIIGLIIQGCGTKEGADGPGATGDKTTSEAPEKQGRDSVTVALVGEDSVTVFELLQRSHYVEFRESSMGNFVLGIDSVRGGTVGNWVYTVNDTVPKVAADKMFTRAGDSVLWKLRIQGD